MDVDPKLVERNKQLLHAMQSGIATKIGAGISRETEPKHLRVGINNALIEVSALQKVLVDKGIIDFNEFFTAVNELLEEEVKRYESELTKHYGGTTEIKLG